MLLCSQYLKILRICCNAVLSDVNYLFTYQNYYYFYNTIIFFIHAANALKTALKIAFKMLLKNFSLYILRVAHGRKFRWGRLFCKLYILISEHKILAEMSLRYPVGGVLMLTDRLEVMLHA